MAGDHCLLVADADLGVVAALFFAVFETERLGLRLQRLR